MIRIFISVLALLSGGVALAQHDLAQETADVVRLRHNRPIDTRFEGARVESLAVVNSDVFDLENERYRGFPYRLANAIHMTTQSHVILSELLVRKGAPFSWEDALESERNLRTRLQLYEVVVEPSWLTDSTVLVTIRTADQWTITGGVSFRKENKATEYRAVISEDNFLGLNQIVDFEYVRPPISANQYVGARYAAQRFPYLPLGGAFAISTDPLGGGVAGIVQRPFYDRRQKWSVSLTGLSQEGDLDLYDDSVKAASVEFVAKGTGLTLRRRWGSVHRKFTLSFMHRYREVERGRVLARTNDSSAIIRALENLPSDTLSNELAAGVDYRGIDYVRLSRIDRHGLIEDFTVGPYMSIMAGRAISHSKTIYDRVGVGFGKTGYFAGNLLLVDNSVERIFAADANDRLNWGSSIRWFNQSVPRVTLAFHGSVQASMRDEGGNLVGLGGFSGLRGYPQFFKNGNRLAFASTELRYFLKWELLTIRFSPVLFSDVGSIWRDGERIDSEKVYGNIGFGLRFFAERFSGGVVIRCDVAYTEAYGWQVSVASGQNIPAFRGESDLTNQ